jgi:predicted Zn-dependent peptidase
VSYISEERFTLSILNSILGGSVNSRLFQKIREDAGLTYSIYSYGSSFKDTGLLHIYSAMNPSQKETVIKKIYSIVESLWKKGITKEELEMTKEQIKTELILGSEGARNRMNFNGKSMLHRRRLVPLSELIEGIEGVGLEEVKGFANRYLNISEASLSLVGNIK